MKFDLRTMLLVFTGITVLVGLQIRASINTRQFVQNVQSQADSLFDTLKSDASLNANHELYLIDVPNFRPTAKCEDLSFWDVLLFRRTVTVTFCTIKNPVEKLDVVHSIFQHELNYATSFSGASLEKKSSKVLASIH